MLSRRQILIGLGASLAGPRAFAGTLGGQARAISLAVEGQQVVGLPLIWERSLGLVLDQDGRLWKVDPGELESPRDAGPYQPATAEEVRGRLAAQLGNSFTIQQTPHYLVATGRGIDSHWAGTVERLNAHFRAYFAKRGISLRRGRFLKIAIITSSEAEMLRIAAAVGDETRDGYLGLYSQMSNRVYLYDHGETQGGVSATVRHEIAHQSAFNAGLHPRLTDTPLWVIEGVGTLFESPALGQGSGASLRERAGTVYPSAFKERFEDPVALGDSMAELIGSDALFERDPDAAYSLSWALTFYFTERWAGAYDRYLGRLGQLKPLAAFSAPQRMHEFTRIFGTDLRRIANDVAALVDASMA